MLLRGLHAPAGWPDSPKLRATTTALSSNLHGKWGNLVCTMHNVPRTWHLLPVLCPSYNILLSSTTLCNIEIVVVGGSWGGGQIVDVGGGGKQVGITLVGVVDYD